MSSIVSHQDKCVNSMHERTFGVSQTDSHNQRKFDKIRNIAPINFGINKSSVIGYITLWTTLMTAIKLA